MLKEDLVPEVHRHPHDLGYSTTTAEDDFEAVHTDVLPAGELSDSYIEIDGTSESGQTAETVSSSDQSDAETIASMDEEDHTGLQPQSLYQILTRSECQADSMDATPIPTSQPQGPLDRNGDEADKEDCKADQSQITVRPAETSADTAKGEAKHTAPAQLSFPDPSDLPAPTDESAIISASNKTLNELDINTEISQASRIFDTPYVASDVPGGRKADAAKVQEDREQTNKATKSSRLVGEYLRSKSRSGLLQLAISVLITVLLVGLVTPLRDLTSTLPAFSSLVRSSLTAQDEMSYRHEQLGAVLTAEGLTGWEGNEIDPTSVLKYPKAYVFGDQGTSGFQYTFQSGVNIHFAGHDQMFVALPKDMRKGRYLVKPIIEVQCFGESIPIADQKDLIPGLTYVRLDTRLVESIYQVHVRAGHIDTTVVAGSYRTLGPPGGPRISSERRGRTFGGAMQALSHDFQQFTKRLVAASARATHEIQKVVRKSSPVIGGHPLQELLRLPSQATGWLSSVRHTVYDATFSKYQDVTEDYGHRIKEYLASSAAVARQASQNIVKSAFQVLDGGLNNFIDVAGPVLQDAVHDAKTALTRAHRNASGIVKRLQSIAAVKKTYLYENVRLHYKAETCQKSCKESHYSCGKAGGRCSGKHGH